MPRVSIIVPTVGRPSLQMALASIEAQTFRDFEILIELDEKREGKSVMINRGVKKANGIEILVVDDDNELMPTFLEETTKAMDSVNAQANKLNGGSIEAIQVGRIIRHTGFDDYAAPSLANGYGFHAIDWGWLIKKYVFDTIQYDPEMKGDDDADFGIQFFKRWKSAPLDKPLTIAYAEGDADSSTFPSKERVESLMLFYIKNWKEYELAGPKDFAFLNRFVGRTLYLAGYKKEAIKYFWKAFKAWKTRRTLTHFLVSLINYKAYYILMRLEERYYAHKRRKQMAV